MRFSRHRANLLIEKEVIFAEDVERIFGKRQWASRSVEIMAANKPADKDAEESKETAPSVESNPETNPSLSKNEVDLPENSVEEENTTK